MHLEAAGVGMRQRPVDGQIAKVAWGARGHAPPTKLLAEDPVRAAELVVGGTSGR